MGNKKITKLYKKGKKIVHRKKIILENQISINDLKHDLENQIVKITQQLEFLLSKSTVIGSIRKKYWNVCREEIDEVSESLTFIDRIANQMTAEIVCMNILLGNNIEAYQTRQAHVVYKIIHRLLMLYEDDFNHRNIKYKILPSSLKWNVNNEILSAILLKIIQNMTKYTLHDSEVEIIIEDHKISFSMTSLKINKNEIEKLFKDGYKGLNGIKSGKSKTGKGLYHAQELCNFHDLEISVTAGSKIATGRDGLDYAINTFEIHKDSSML